MVADSFVCDEMLQGVGRWLRAAGYDTLIAGNGEHDAELLQLARREGRIFLTRDRKLWSEHHRDRNIVLLLEANDVPGCIAELSARCELDWCKAPFSRCLLCNTPLTEIGPAQREMVRGQVPEDVWAAGQPVLYCPSCHKAYWEGSHVRHMRKRLQAFNRGVWQ